MLTISTIYKPAAGLWLSGRTAVSSGKPAIVLTISTVGPAQGPACTGHCHRSLSPGGSPGCWWVLYLPGAPGNNIYIYWFSMLLLNDHGTFRFPFWVGIQSRKKYDAAVSIIRIENCRKKSRSGKAGYHQPKNSHIPGWRSHRPPIPPPIPPAHENHIGKENHCQKKGSKTPRDSLICPHPYGSRSRAQTIHRTEDH